MNAFAPTSDSAVEPVVPIRPSRRDPAATRQKWVARIERFSSAGLTIAQF